MVNSRRISDGIVRLYYIANERAMEVMNKETILLQDLCKLWGIDQPQILPTARRFFEEYKKLSTATKKQDGQILELQMKCVLSSEPHKVVIESEHGDPTLYFSHMSQYASGLKEAGKGVIFIGDSFIFGLLGDKDMVNLEELQELLGSTNEKVVVKKSDKVSYKVKGQKKATQVKDVLQLSIPGLRFEKEDIIKYFVDREYEQFQ